MPFYSLSTVVLPRTDSTWARHLSVAKPNRSLHHDQPCAFLRSPYRRATPYQLLLTCGAVGAYPFVVILVDAILAATGIRCTFLLRFYGTRCDCCVFWMARSVSFIYFCLVSQFQNRRPTNGPLDSFIRSRLFLLISFRRILYRRTDDSAAINLRTFPRVPSFFGLRIPDTPSVATTVQRSTPCRPALASTRPTTTRLGRSAVVSRLGSSRSKPERR